LEIVSFSQLPSTQHFLLEALSHGTLETPVAVITEEQVSGVGSRDNQWEGGKGNFFASFAIAIEKLPSDLPLGSASIYFSYIMKQTLVDFDEEVWLKWPNDFYYKHEKVGGTITQKVGDVVVCGMGINLKKTSNAYASLETTIDPKVLLEAYLKSLEKFPSWKQIFSEYEIEFEKSRAFSAHIENQKTNLLEAILCQDGSLIINQKKVFSLR